VGRERRNRHLDDAQERLARFDLALFADHAERAAFDRTGSEAADIIPAGKRSATCSALNYLELARLGRAEFFEMLQRFPILRRRLVEQSLASLRSDSEVSPLAAEAYLLVAHTYEGIDGEIRTTVHRRGGELLGDIRSVAEKPRIVRHWTRRPEMD
jgi:CRP-like cAMP-binding protein